MSSPGFVCGCCKRPLSSPMLCSRCKGVRYCNSECQKIHWKTHKKQCHKAETSSVTDSPMMNSVDLVVKLDEQRLPCLASGPFAGMSRQQQLSQLSQLRQTSLELLAKGHTVQAKEVIKQVFMCEILIANLFGTVDCLINMSDIHGRCQETVLAVKEAQLAVDVCECSEVELARLMEFAPQPGHSEQGMIPALGHKDSVYDRIGTHQRFVQALVAYGNAHSANYDTVLAISAYKKALSALHCPPSQRGEAVGTGGGVVSDSQHLMRMRMQATLHVNIANQYAKQVGGAGDDDLALIITDNWKAACQICATSGPELDDIAMSIQLNSALFRLRRGHVEPATTELTALLDTDSGTSHQRLMIIIALFNCNQKVSSQERLIPRLEAILNREIDEDCAICTDTLRTEPMQILQCTHVFHCSCWAEYVQKCELHQGAVLCLLCRAKAQVTTATKKVDAGGDISLDFHGTGQV